MEPMLIGLMGLIGLVGCSAEVEEPVAEEAAQGMPVEVRSSVTAFEEVVGGAAAGTWPDGQGTGASEAAVTRAWLPPIGYSFYDGADSKTIGVRFTQNGKEPLQGYFFMSSGQWRVSLLDGAELSAEPYYLYGYIPHTTGMSSEISSTAMSGDNSAYSGGAVLKLKNVPTVMPSDLCVVIGAKNGRTDYRSGTDYSVTGLTRGNFEYVATATLGEGTGNYVYMLFDHLYSVMRIQMKVHSEYTALCTIKLKELRLQTATDGDAAKAKTDITVALAANGTGSDPITSVIFTPDATSGDSDGVVFTSGAGQTLTTDYSTFQSYFMPDGVTKLLLTSTYDVYDNNRTQEHPDGNLVRQDCQATNALEISKLFDRQTEARRGFRYTINITIRPTYLYMLSEPDLNNPTMEVE